jgi:hypothetical protein
VIQAFRRLRQDDEFKASLGYIVRIYLKKIEREREREANLAVTISFPQSVTPDMSSSSGDLPAEGPLLAAPQAPL